MRVRTAAVIAMLAFPRLAWPCSVVAPMPTPRQLIDQATAIVRVRALGVVPEPGQPGVLAGASTQMGFEVLERLKGSVESHDLHFNGGASRHDDPNDTKVPYSFVRPGGRGGNCFALEYRPGAEYLLFLRAGDVPAYAQQSMLTPYWAPLSPTNEQLVGRANDPWVVWVRARLRKPSGA